MRLWGKHVAQMDVNNFDLPQLDKVFHHAIIRSQCTALLCGLSGLLIVEWYPLLGLLGVLMGFGLMCQYRFSRQRALLFRYAKTLAVHDAVWLESSPKLMWLFVLCLVMICAALGERGWAMWSHVRSIAAFGALSGMFGFYGWYRTQRLLRLTIVPAAVK